MNLRLGRFFFCVCFAASLNLSMAGDYYVNVDSNGVALKGYDPVAYFIDKRPTKGKKEIYADYHGARYHFASEENRIRFEADPAKYEPQFGGFCAFAVSRGYTAPIEVDAFQIHDGKLLLQNSVTVRALFNRDKEGNYRKAVTNWPKLEAKQTGKQ